MLRLPVGNLDGTGRSTTAHVSVAIVRAQAKAGTEMTDGRSLFNIDLRADDNFSPDRDQRVTANPVVPVTDVCYGSASRVVPARFKG